MLADVSVRCEQVAAQKVIHKNGFRLVGSSKAKDFGRVSIARLPTPTIPTLVKKTLLICAIATLIAAPSQAQLYWNTTGTNASWNSTNWGTSASGPFTNAWVSGSDVVFGALSTNTNFTTTIGNITVNANTTITAGGTVSSKAGGSIVDVADGVTLAWSSQNRSTTGTNNIWTKSGNGTWNIGAGTTGDPGTGASFTLNAGTVAITGARALGGPNSVLNINGGVLSIATTATLGNSVINVGGDFGLAGSTTLAVALTGNVALGSSTRTITNTATGTRTFSGNISASSASAGLTLAGTGTTTLGGTNTYTGNTAVTGGVLNLADNAQLRFSIGGNGINNQLTQSGSAVVNLDGDFVFDLTGAGTTVGNSWTLTSGTINYNGLGGTFSVFSTLGAFTETSSGVWTRDENSVTYQFSELNSQLSVVPEPSTYAMLVLGAAGLGAHVIRRRRRG